MMVRLLRRLSFLTFLLAVAVAGGAPTANAAVPDPFTVGYVWNDQPLRSGCFAPASNYSYNSTTAANSICHTGVGSYVVHFPNLATPGGNAQVTAYGSTPANCKVAYWVPSGSEEQVGVNCYTFAGAPVDTNFTASFTAGGGSANTISFAWANDPTSASYTPSSTYQYNNRGGLATITHGAIGSYAVSFPDSFGASAAGGVKVTSYGAGSGVCKVVSWGANAGATAQVVNVQCYDSAGNPSNQQFSVVYVNGQNILGDNLLGDGYAWADQPSSGSYMPALAYQRSTTVASSGTVSITSPAVGTYDVFLPYQDQGLDGGHAQVTAYGSGTARCQVGYWVQTTGGRTVRVYCFTNGGSLTDTYFALQYTGKVQ